LHASSREKPASRASVPAPETPRQVLVVDDDGAARQALVLALARHGCQATAASNAQAAAELSSRAWDVVVCAAGAAPQLAAEAARKKLPAAVIIICAPGEIDAALEHVKAGAYGYVVTPLRIDELLVLMERAAERDRLARENAALKQQLARATGEGPRAMPLMIARSSKMEEVLRTIKKIAEYKTTVLINGESGTGKELVARALHDQSPRSAAPFVAVNCGAIPEPLLESELFGHKKGSFTDAIRDKKGLFEEADGGTLFLDEIGELPLGPQVKLLRVLQEQVVRPVGAVDDQKVDVRVVAATVRDLAVEAREGRFRDDLFYRLNVITLQLPPLRERKDDIVPLVEHFIARTNVKLGTSIEGVAPDALKLLVDYRWPGNVRELENTIERAMVLCDGKHIVVESLPERIRDSRDRIRLSLQSGELSIKKTTRIIEEELIRKALRETRGNRTNAAKILEISHRALLYKIKEFEIDDA
jgi:two-component system, NtrC family, response regulator AtoC